MTERRKFLYHLQHFPGSRLLTTEKNKREIESVQMVSAISFGWFADFEKALTIIQCQVIISCQRSSKLVVYLFVPLVQPRSQALSPLTREAMEKERISKLNLEG